MIELTLQQREDIKSANGEVVRVTDPDTKQEYVLVPREIYEQLVALLDNGVRASGELVDRIMTEDDAHDPSLASYQS